MFYYQDVEANDAGKATLGFLQHTVVLLSKCAKKNHGQVYFINWGLRQVRLHHLCSRSED